MVAPSQITNSVFSYVEYGCHRCVLRNKLHAPKLIILIEFCRSFGNSIGLLLLLQVDRMSPAHLIYFENIEADATNFRLCFQYRFICSIFFLNWNEADFLLVQKNERWIFCRSTEVSVPYAWKLLVVFAKLRRNCIMRMKLGQTQWLLT